MKRLIQPTDGAAADGPIHCLPKLGDIRREAARRKELADYSRLHTRFLATGVGIPTDIQHHVLQIDYVALALARLEPIPKDFRDDRYWPALPTERNAGTSAKADPSRAPGNVIAFVRG